MHFRFGKTELFSGAELLVLRRVRLCGEGSLEINGLLSGWKNDENIAFINGVDVGLFHPLIATHHLHTKFLAPPG